MYQYLPVELGLFYAYIANEFICHCLFQIAHLLSAAFFTATENIYFVLKRNTHNLPRTLNSQELFSILSAFKLIFIYVDSYTLSETFHIFRGKNWKNATGWYIPWHKQSPI